MKLRTAIWEASRRDLLLGLPWIPLYSAAELCLGFAITALVQLIFADTPRVPVSGLVPSEFRFILNFGQTLDRKDLAFAVPLIIVVAGFVKLISSFLSSYLIERAGHRVAHRLREKLLSGFLSAPGNILDSKNSDSAANQVIMDTTLLQGAVSRGTMSALRDGCVIVAVFASMLVLAFKTVVFSLVVVVPCLLALRKISKALNFYARESAKRQVALATRSLQTRNGLLTVFGLRTQSRELFDFARMADFFYVFIRRSFLVRTGFRPFTEFVVVLTLAGLLQWRFSARAELNVATYSALFVLAALAFRPLKNVSSLIAQWSEIRVVYERVNAEWNQMAIEKERSSIEPLPSRSPFALQVKNLSYVAASGETLLAQCQLDVPRGLRVALVGESGAGKTTFLRCVAGLLQPSEGSIALEPEFLLATQSPYVFKGNVRENVVYASRSSAVYTSDDVSNSRGLELMSVLKLAHTPAGENLFYDKKVCYFGDGLSGGEKARVALARILYASPKLILLDEPTANLDPASAQAFWHAVDTWKARDSEHTVIAVSHALSEVAHWDLCFVFERGRIVRFGRPAELLASAKALS